jgi:hypothetical protein
VYHVVDRQCPYLIRCDFRADYGTTLCPSTAVSTVATTAAAAAAVAVAAAAADAATAAFCYR